jgi:hypothetical protein
MMIANEICDGVVCFLPLRATRVNMIESFSLELEQLFMMSLAQ